ncbi:hypothetical protein C8F01DRAFT_1264242 [Mycena amicta]|nr:hypothetical protein C8F01DRAFT_1264242 [Mycena amicta]
MYPHQNHSSSSSSRVLLPHSLAPQPEAEDSNVLLLKFAPRSRTAAARSVLNCTVVGEDGCTPYYHIMSGDASTVLRTNAGKTVASVDWSAGTSGSGYVQVQNALARTRVSQWLAISPDGSYRSMLAMGQQYVWFPQPKAICMYRITSPNTQSTSTPRLIARIEKVMDRSQDRYDLTLEVAIEAASISGLLTMIVLATTLLHSGYSLD